MTERRQFVSGASPSAGRPLEVDLNLVAAIESHCVRAWPPAHVAETSDGWVLRATPGLPGRGRSNHALPPVRRIDPSEYDGALRAVERFAAEHGVECGIQMSPVDLHAPMIDELGRRGWSLGQDVLVMVADTQAVAAAAVDHPGLELDVNRSATTDWVAAWTHCDHRQDVQDHVEQVFPLMAGTACFAHSAMQAVGISVELDGIVGLFCLAVDPALRRRGLGKALVRAMLSHHDSAPLTYLQVYSRNIAGVALYRSLGFRELYSYRHAMAPTPA